jgi:hypothetical protein
MGCTRYGVAVKLLISSPAVLDLFVWLSYPIIHGERRRTHSFVRRQRVDSPVGLC